MQNELEHYQNLDTSHANVVEPEVLKKLKERKRYVQQAFDIDVLDWLYKQDDETKRHINDMIRHAMALKNSDVA